MEHLQIIAGSISSLIFMLGSLNMLIKAWRTRDMRSYSLVQLVLYNIGNGVHWLYVISLPFGPIYVMHTFFTVSQALMLTWAVLYRCVPEDTKKRITDTYTRIRQTTER